MHWGMLDEVYRETGDGPRERRAHRVRVYLSLLCWAENHYWWSAIFKGFPSGGDWMGRDEPLKKTRQGEWGWYQGIEGKGGKRTRGWRKAAVILSAGAVSPMGASVDAPGSILKYNTDGFYVDFRTHLMSLFPAIHMPWSHSLWETAIFWTICTWKIFIISTAQ